MADTKWGDLVKGTQSRATGAVVFNSVNSVDLGGVALAKDLNGPATNGAVARNSDGAYLG